MGPPLAGSSRDRADVNRKKRTILWAAVFLLLLMVSVNGAIHWWKIDTRNDTKVHIVVTDADDESRETLSNASVYLDGKLISRGSGNVGIVWLEPGRHVIRVTAPGYVPQEEVIEAGPTGGEAYPAFSLRRKQSE